MKKIIFLLLIAFICSGSIYSQQYSKRWGLIWQKERDLKVYKKDPKAEAVVIYDIGESFFYDTDDGGYNIRFTRTRKIKILNTAGDRFAQVSIPYYVDGFGESEFVTKIEAFAYNEVNGEIKATELDKNTIYEEKLDEFWFAKKFAIPNVKEGTIIEYRYVLETPFLFNLPDWQFQDRIPTIYSEYNVRMIPFYEYSFISQGIERFDYQDTHLGKHNRYFGKVIKSFGKNIGSGVEFRDLVHTYVMEDVPAFKDESFITSINDYIMKIDFQLAKINYTNGDSKEIMTNWPKLIDELLKSPEFGKYLKKCKALAKGVFKNDLIIDGLDNDKIAQNIINYVRSSFTWNGSYSKFASKTTKEFYIQKTGNSADINLFLVAMLQSAGIDAHPAILSTRNHGQIKVNYPYAHFFNNVIVLIKTESQTYLSDATNNYIAYNRIPPKCINGKGLVVDDTDVKWVELNLNPLSYDFKTIKLDIKPHSLVANTTVYVQATEYEGFEYRNTFQNDTTRIRNFLLNGGLTSVYELESINYRNTHLPYIVIGEGESEFEKIENQFVVFPFLDFPIKENKLTQIKRSYPVDIIYSIDKAFHSVITIPDNYKITSYPEDFNLQSDLIEIDLEYLPSVTGIEVTARYTFKKAVYKPYEYPRLKFYINTIIKKFNKPIVLEKISL